jgi:hypothetical protein
MKTNTPRSFQPWYFFNQAGIKIKYRHENTPAVLTGKILKATYNSHPWPGEEMIFISPLLMNPVFHIHNSLPPDVLVVSKPIPSSLISNSSLSSCWISFKLTVLALAYLLYY